MFVDETGESNVKKDDPRFNIFSLCGIIISHENYRILDDAMKALKMNFWGTDKIVFRSFEMRGQHGKFQIFQDPMVLAEFYTGVGKILSDIDYTIVSCVIQKEKYRASHPGKVFAYDVAMEFICERYCFYLNRITDVQIKAHVCFEKRNRSDNRYLQKQYINLITNGNKQNKPDNFRKLHRIAHFRDKKENVNGLQLADICAYPIASKILHPNRSQKTYDIIKPKIYSWQGRIEGIGLKVYPK